MLETLSRTVLTQFFPRLLNWIFPDRAKRHRTEQLEKLLKDERFPQGRSLKELRLKTGTTASECRTLLSEIGAEGIKLHDGKEGWRLLALGDGE